MRMFLRRSRRRQETVVGMRNKEDEIPVSFKHCNAKTGSGITLRYNNLSSYN